MTNAPSTRKTHVIRQVGTNRNGDVLQDIWLDIERIDIAKSVTQNNATNWQGHQRKFRWMDDPDSDDYNTDGNPARKLQTIKVCDVESQTDPNDPDEWVPVQVIASLHARDSDRGVVDRYHTGVDDDPTLTTRVVEVRRMVHYDTNIDADAQAAFDADPTRTAYVVQGSDYTRDDSTKDDTQYVEQEVVKSLKHRTNNTSRGSGDIDTGRQTKLLNQYLIDESDEATQQIIGANGINPPYRLDPYQNIVNVQFGHLDQQYMDSWFIFRTTDTLPTSNFGNDLTSGASLSNTTVFTSGYIASGKIKDEQGVTKSIFVRAPFTQSGPDWGRNPTDIFIGGIKQGGVIEWSGGISVLGAVTAISYANKKFFITYTDGFKIYLSITSDGVSFTTVQPWEYFIGPPDSNGRPSGLNSGSGASAVAYQNGIYVMVGYVVVEEIISTDATIIVDGGGCNNGYSEIVTAYNLAWATSTDGLGWVTEFAPGLYGDDGLGGGNTGIGSCVAAGNGVFVTGASIKHTTQELIPGPPPGTVKFSCCIGDPIHGPYHCNLLQATRPDYILTSAAVAVSRDGQHWDLVKLPDAGASNSVDGDSGSNGDLVVFIENRKHAAPGTNKTGYFVASSQWSSSVPSSSPTGSLWMSEDGYSWTEISTEDNKGYVYLSAVAEKIKNRVVQT